MEVDLHSGMTNGKSGAFYEDGSDLLQYEHLHKTVLGALLKRNAGKKGPA